MDLGNWVNPDKLSPAAMAAMAQSFAENLDRVLVIDDFLRPEKAELLARMFLEEARFETKYSLWGEGPTREEYDVTKEEWLQARQELRSSFETRFVGPKPESQIGAGMVAYIRFQALMGSAHFRAFMQAISGGDLGATSMAPPRLAGYGHFVKPHSDVSDGSRQLCCVYYVSPGWRPDFGGEFRQVSAAGGSLEVAPRANRLLVFPPDPDRRHEVLPITEAAGSWQRGSCTVWFLRPEAS